ncbi:sulfotransferase family 2 domain-containing protein [Zunongwangia endophytica]|uniref:Sulfotransferase family 2 domain-containing protein n=1 Tax=Zunongwangia endophytica TaxID=1808945 RepID=A0ABV8HB15_9FLAO|nr:sulfotransferase family 2 domain-containing protein [Zunongwangia endophytica]MDN3595043.1 sulfotransferase family 2 domain-containing protein [Zunongwangia endophytica]
MISHKHKCIFIHISKCAGSSIETAFGIDVSNNSESNNSNLFGWNEELKMHLQHATPEELIQNNLLSSHEWNNYYKFIIVRNPWDRLYSDYCWLSKEQNINDSFFNYINATGKFSKVLNCKNILYRGDHLKSQINYFCLDNQKIDYDQVIFFEQIQNGLEKVCRDLELPSSFFSKKVNMGKKKKNHYSFFYNQRRKDIVKEKFKNDIEFLNYFFEDRKDGLIDYIRSNSSSKSFII